VASKLAGDRVGRADPDERGGQDLLDREPRHPVGDSSCCGFGVIGDLDVLYERFELWRTPSRAGRRVDLVDRCADLLGCPTNLMRCPSSSVRPSPDSPTLSACAAA
jgi:hypothetical protein